MKKKLFAILISFYANSLISMERATFVVEIPNSQTVGNVTIDQSSQQDVVATQQQPECSTRCVLRGTRNVLACLILAAGSAVAAWYFGYYVVSPMLPNNCCY